MKNDNSAYRYMGWVTGLGVTMIACIVIGLYAGLYIDKKFGTSPWIALIFMVLGMIAGAWSVYKGIMMEIKKDERPD